jgi:hypothetical protein
MVLSATPAFAAISSVPAPEKPSRANTSMPASTILIRVAIPAGFIFSLIVLPRC